MTDKKIDYVLLVDLVVLEKDCPKFERLVGEFLANEDKRSEMKKRTTSRLLLGLKSVEPFMYASDGTLDEFTKKFRRGGTKRRERVAYRYLHLWEVDNPRELDIGRRMILCADDREYMRINSLVVSEIQDFVRRVGWATPVEMAANLDTETRFVRSVRRLATKDIGTYLFKLRGLFGIFEKAKWKPLGQYQPITGALGLVHEFWLWKGRPRSQNFRRVDRLYASARTAVESMNHVVRGDQKIPGKRIQSRLLAELKKVDKDLVLASGAREGFLCPDYFLEYMKLEGRR